MNKRAETSHHLNMCSWTKDYITDLYGTMIYRYTCNQLTRVPVKENMYLYIYFWNASAFETSWYAVPLATNLTTVSPMSQSLPSFPWAPARPHCIAQRNAESHMAMSLPGYDPVKSKIRSKNKTEKQIIIACISRCFPSLWPLRQPFLESLCVSDM